MRTISKMRCPKCNNPPTSLKEVGTVSASYFIKDGKIYDHTLNPDDFHPIKVIAQCSCENEWKLNGVSSMNDIEEYKDYGD